MSAFNKYEGVCRLSLHIARTSRTYHSTHVVKSTGILYFARLVPNNLIYIGLWQIYGRT